MDPKEDLLTKLQDIDLPQHSGWWVAPGWYVLTILVVLISWFAYKRWSNYREYQRTNWRPEALAAVNQLRTDIDDGQLDGILSGASRLARRIALAAGSREEVAALTGERWLQKLDEMSQTEAFTKGAGRLLATAPYRSKNPEDETLLRDVIDAVESLIVPTERSADRQPQRIAESSRFNNNTQLESKTPGSMARPEGRT